MVDLLAQLAPTDRVPAGHYGVAATGVTITLCDLPGIASVAGAVSDAACQARFGIVPPTGPRFVQGTEVGFLGLGPGRWLALGPADPEDVLGPVFGPTASVCDQGDAYVLFEVTGPAARAALAKGVTVDLDPAAFGPGDVATTVIAFIGVTLWLVDAAPTFRLLVGRSFAPSFSRFLIAGAAEFGCELAIRSDG